MNEQQLQLFEFVKKKHEGQLRKYTGEPYHVHPLEVAHLVEIYAPELIEIALCHDLYEDTTCDFSELYKEMLRIGYTPNFAYDTCTVVNELSDKFTKDNYPYMNRAKRKNHEAVRLGNCSVKAQTVKYADLINNTDSIVEHDKRFAKTYLEEKKFALAMMNDGHNRLKTIALQSLKDSQAKLILK